MSEVCKHVGTFDVRERIDTAVNAAVLAANEGLKSAITAVEDEIQEVATSVLDLVGAGSFMPLAKEIFGAGISEVNARTEFALVRSQAVLRLQQSVAHIPTIDDTTDKFNKISNSGLGSSGVTDGASREGSVWFRGRTAEGENSRSPYSSK